MMLTPASRHALWDAERDKAGNKPLVKLFTPNHGATWLLSELDKDNIAFGLCDLGLGFPEMGYVSLDELAAMGDIVVEQDVWFKADKTLVEYADEARANGRIMA